MHDDRLLDTKHAKRFDFLIECLKQRRSGFGMQNSTWMRIESDDSRHCARCTRTLNHSVHDQLVSEVQTVKHTEREHGRSMNSSVVSSVKETHQLHCRFPIADCQFLSIGNWQSEIGNIMTRPPGHRKQTQLPPAAWRSRAHA